MAGFEGIRWASTQLKYDMTSGEATVERDDSKVFAVSRSLHYGLFLAFEGIRFRCRLRDDGSLGFTFFNLGANAARFRRSMLFNLAADQHHLVPSVQALQTLFLRYLSLPENRPLFLDMARTGQQGYLRPFTADESQSIGVTFPARPCIRMIAAGYDAYLGEPFDGVTVPGLVRAVGVNGTGCLKLGINYLISVRAVAWARGVLPGASSALFLDDRPDLPVDDRIVTEWDSSCCLLAMKDGSFIRIPDSPLILPSITVRGIESILRMRGHEVVERDMSFGELCDRTAAGELVTVCSIGTAGILNRVRALHLHDGEAVRAIMRSDQTHPGYQALAEARTHYWDIYRFEADVPEGHERLELEALAG